jgi:hypothetical protein
MVGGISLGVVVEGSVAVLLAVTIGYCVILNGRLKRLHADRETLAKTVADLVQVTALANAAVAELKTAALEADNNLNERIAEAGKCETELAGQVAVGSQLVQKIARITAAAKQPQALETRVEKTHVKPPEPIEPQGRLASALQQLAMRPGIGGKAA